MAQPKLNTDAVIQCYITEKRVLRASKLPQADIRRTVLREEFKKDGEKYTDSDACFVTGVRKVGKLFDALVRDTEDKWFFTFIPRHMLIMEFRASGDNYYVRFSAHGVGDIEWALSKGDKYLSVVAAGQPSPRLPGEAKEELRRMRNILRDEYICCYFWRYKKEKDNDGWHVEGVPKGRNIADVKEELIKVINEMPEERARFLLERIRREEATAKSILAYASESEKRDNNSDKNTRRPPSSQSLFSDADIPYTLR